MNEDFGLEHLLAGVILANGGTFTIPHPEQWMDSINVKSIAIDLNEDGTITMRLVDYDNN